MKSKLERWINGALFTTSMAVALTSCEPDDDPVPINASIDQSVTLQNKNELLYKATLNNVDAAVLTISKDGKLILTEDISDVAKNGLDYQKVLSNGEYPDVTKGKYDFKIRSNNFSSDNLEKKSSIEIPNYKPTANLGQLDLNFMEAFDVNASFSKDKFLDDNPEDNPVSVTGVKSVDGKTTPTLKTTATGYDLNVKAVPGSIGAYQLELDFGSDQGGLEKSVLSGTIGKDTRIVINPKDYTDNPNAVYNSLTTRVDRDNYILGELFKNPGNNVPYSATKYTCTMYQIQLIRDAIKSEEKIRAPSSDFGKYWLYNNSKETSIDSIYQNGGHLGNAIVEVPVLMVNIKDDTHSYFRHGINAVLTGRDMSTGNLLTNFNNYNFIEPQHDATNLPIGSFQLKKDLDEIRIEDVRVVEDPINGNYFESVHLVTFKLDNGVPTLIFENTDPKYNIIKQ